MPLVIENRLSPLIQLSLAIRNSPASALKLLANVDKVRLAKLANDQLALLYFEAIRVNDTRAIDKLKNILPISLIEEQTLKLFVMGEAIDLDGLDLEPDLQAAAYFIRSRNPQIAGGERSALRGRAARTDYLRGIVTTAISQW